MQSHDCCKLRVNLTLHTDIVGELYSSTLYPCDKSYCPTSKLTLWLARQLPQQQGAVKEKQMMNDDTTRLSLLGLQTQTVRTQSLYRAAQGPERQRDTQEAQ